MEKKWSFFLLVGRRIYGGLNERKEIYLFRGGGSLWFPRNIASHAWQETSNHAENLNDCHYCPTNYSRSIIQPLFGVGNKEREHSTSVYRQTHTPLFTKYTTKSVLNTSWSRSDSSFVVTRYLSNIQKEKKRESWILFLHLFNYVRRFVLPFESIRKEKHSWLNAT